MATDGAAGRRMRIAGVLVLLVGAIRPAFSQTPSPLQEWQYSRGLILIELFDIDLPETLLLTGVAAERGPLYDGASSSIYRTRGGPAWEFRYRDIAFASLGEGAGVNLLRGKNYQAGVSVAYDLGRYVSDDSVHLRGLTNISRAPVLKLFGTYAVSRELPLVLRSDLRKFVGGAAGVEGDLGAYMPLPGSNKTFYMFAGPGITWSDRRHLVRSFGISAEDALRSGYPVFQPHAGIEAVGFGFSATYLLSTRWMFNLDAAVDRISGSARDSPITAQKVQHTVALSVLYRW